MGLVSILVSRDAAAERGRVAAVNLSALRYRVAANQLIVRFCNCVSLRYKYLRVEHAQSGVSSMSSIAITFGSLLVLLGGALFGLSEKQSPTAFIPSGFGLALIICGLLARKESLRKHAMHGAAMVGLLGFGGGLFQGIKNSLGGSATGLAIGGQYAMAALCAIFVALCVKSFIDVRKARKARELAG